MRYRLALILCAFCAVVSAPSRAQTPPMAPQFQVNTTTAGGQYGYGVGMDRNGNFVVVWDMLDGSSYGVTGRRFGANGTALGGEFQANSYTTDKQEYSSAAMDRNGDFVVIWQGYGPGGDYGVFARQFDRFGTAANPEIGAATTTGTVSNSQVAVDAGGNFVVVWSNESRDGSLGGVFGRRFDNAGTHLGAEFQINTYTSLSQLPDDVAMDFNGDFVVVWEGNGPSGYGVFGRRFDSAGAAQGGQFQLGTAVGYEASVAMSRTGDFVIVWQGTDGDVGGILGQLFDSTGAPVGTEFVVNTYTTGRQQSPRVAMDPVGNFLVAWQSTAQDGDDEGVFARRYDRFGTAVSSEFAVNTYTTGYQGLPRVATNHKGAFVIEWQDGTLDGDGYGVFARRGTLTAADSIVVDGHASSGSSDVNGVLEPGETVLVETGWSNSGSSGATFTGSSPALTGPPGATYTLTDSSADYGTVAAGSAANCRDASGDCYEISVSNPATRPATHWDVDLQENLSAGVPKNWTLHVGHSFSDVPETQPFYKKIEALFHSGVTTGCTATTYCPGDTVSRSQMSLFVARGIAGSGAAIPSKGNVGANAYNCTSGGVSLFTDVAPTDIECKSVHYIAAQNVTLGCSPTTYCPADTVTRIQMAAFVAKAVVAPGGGPAVPVTYGPDPVTGFSYSCNTGSPNVHFTDVPATDSFCKHVHYLWAKGIITGCGATTYCPGDSVTRDAMAKFLDNGFNLQLYGP